MRINWFCDHPDHGAAVARRKRRVFRGDKPASKPNLELSRFEAVEFSRPSETYGEMLNHIRGLGWKITLDASNRPILCLCPEHAKAAPRRAPSPTSAA